MKYIFAITALIFQLNLMANQPKKKPQVIVLTDGHVIVEASDFPSIGPGLKTYQRFVVTVKP